MSHSRVIYLAILLALGSGAAACNPKPRDNSLSRAREGWPKFIHHSVMRLNQLHPRYLSVIFGNREVGYFETSQIDQTPTQLSFDLLPPSYELPVEVYGREESTRSLKLLRRVQFTHPLSPELRPIHARREGALTFPFLIYPYKLEAWVAAVLNRRGEVIWAVPVGEAQAHDDPAPLLKPMGPDRLGVLTFARSAFFEILGPDSRSQVLLDSKQWSEAGFFHHDFIQGTHPESVMLLGAQCRGFSEPYDERWIRRGKLGALADRLVSRLLPKRFSVSRVSEIDWVKKKIQLLWTLDRFYSPLREVSLFWARGLDPFLAEPSLWAYPRIYFKTLLSDEFSPFRCNVEWDHTNSIARTPDGILMSHRNLNRIVLYDRSLSKVLWSVGRDEAVTYRTDAQSHFSGQHTASLTHDGELLLFDNHVAIRGVPSFRSAPRILKLKLDRASHTATQVWEYRLPGYAPTVSNRGSALELSNGHILGFFPALLKRNQEDVFVEFKPPSVQPKAKMVISTGGLWTGYQGAALQNFGSARFIGYEVRAGRPQ